jgi:carbon-monoxide dehydrogenase medium subunit
MKPAAFHYFAPRTLSEALDLLAAHAPDAKVLAGGQSLVPLMNFRLARPRVLIDINRIPELAFLEVANGALRIGALARHSQFERPVVEGPLGALLPRVARHIAHLPIRTRGTFAGSLAHADPSAEWCALALALDAEILARSRAARRAIPAGDFFRTLFTTTLGADEVITEVRLPALDGSWRTGFAEFSRRAGDFAIVAAIAAVRLDGRRIAEARLGLAGVVDRPIRASAAEQGLIGATFDTAAVAAAADLAARSVDPLEDVQAPAAYKRDLVRAMVRRALVQAEAS